MRFPFAAAAALFGCLGLLSNGICAAKPLSARRDLSSISEEITARSLTGLTLARRQKLPKLPRVEFLSVGGRVEALSAKEIKAVKKTKAQQAKVLPAGDLLFFRNVKMTPEVVTLKEGRRVVWFVYITCDDAGRQQQWKGNMPLGAGGWYGRLFDDKGPSCKTRRRKLL
ncbi:hypothetical protein BDP27DRAFT_1365724 [Rhodocollybia butyracea]|uniref:Uncharacterized protein n=1 Tax=Rhodocollybia butyracea TaxID=206335 RepID=A0A9P5PLY7_9AGAR|nr:hypothetical protein BDP27DRAFT_1365724 [Rhodocollybia butyracea]